MSTCSRGPPPFGGRTTLHHVTRESERWVDSPGGTLFRDQQPGEGNLYGNRRVRHFTLCAERAWDQHPWRRYTRQGIYTLDLGSVMAGNALTRLGMVQWHLTKVAPMEDGRQMSPTTSYGGCGSPCNPNCWMSLIPHLGRKLSLHSLSRLSPTLKASRELKLGPHLLVSWFAFQPSGVLVCIPTN